MQTRENISLSVDSMATSGSTWAELKRAVESREGMTIGQRQMTKLPFSL